MLITIPEFENKLVELTNQFHINSKIKENLELDTKAFLEKNTNIEKEIKLLDETKMLLETLKVHKLKEKKDFILNIINTALTDIFQDNIRIAIEPQEVKGKTNISGSQKFDIIFYQNDIELARNEELLITNGGGIMQVVSMLFKILIGFIYSKNTLYTFDESFSQLSTDNRIRLSKFLQMFCEQYNFTIVVVSQVLDLDEYADIIYSVNANYNNKGIRTLVLEDTIIKDDILTRNAFEGEEGIWYLKIKNFQSISELKLAFKGYTIIRGPNNSGKSAVLRAVSSILYNSFNVKKYPRKVGGLDTKGKPNKKVLETEILLRKTYLQDTRLLNDSNSIPESIHKEIGLKYKSNKVSFIIDNEEYFGKNLAGEKLMEKIEELGFKYINTKEFYKNFKGNLKDQTERIASTTQYDGLFLVGAKGNETEKIFNFLFNTENITKAILKIKEEMIFFSKEHENNQIRVLENTSKIETITNEINYYLKMYYLTIINNIKLYNTDDYKKNIINIENNIKYRKDIIDIYQNNILIFNNDFLKVNKNMETINGMKNNIKILDKKLLELSDKIALFSTVKSSLDNLNIKLLTINKGIALKQTSTLESNNFYMNQEKIKKLDSRLNIIKSLIYKLENYNKINKYLDLFKISFKELNQKQLYLEPVINQLQNIKIKHETLFTKCSHCEGKGYIIKGKHNVIGKK